MHCRTGPLLETVKRLREKIFVGKTEKMIQQIFKPINRDRLYENLTIKMIQEIRQQTDVAFKRQVSNFSNLTNFVVLSENCPESFTVVTWEGPWYQIFKFLRYTLSF